MKNKSTTSEPKNLKELQALAVRKRNKVKLKGEIVPIMTSLEQSAADFEGRLMKMVLQIEETMEDPIFQALANNDTDLQEIFDDFTAEVQTLRRSIVRDLTSGDWEIENGEWIAPSENPEVMKSVERWAKKEVS